MTESSVSLAILFADIAQSTKLYDKIGNTAAHALISSCIAVMTKVCNANEGRVIKTIGAEVMCSFPTAKNAVDAAIAMHAAVDAIPESELYGHYSPDIYVGIDYGPVIVENEDVFGDSVNVASRMVKMAKRRQIMTTPDVVGALPPEYGEYFRCVDKVMVKGKSEEFSVYEIVWEKEKLTVALNSGGEGKSLIRPRLEIICGNKHFEVSEARPTITIGRLDHNDLVVDDNRVSRFHARIEYRKDKFFIVDQSTNGTYVTNECGTTVLVQRDEMQLGDNGIIDLCNEQVSDSSLTAILYSTKYYSSSGSQVAVSASAG